ncbi:MAG: hypothetical protein UR68_C0010G0004 [Candidatus Roizmanbacteria bacterium GW2011_GWA2_35_19]|uniref:Uncharacterized protein n=2 Tax=Candidatus Roizmaniibacteriota TaxID=1752723 RepID=A0A0G0BU22_9BACT|nr:MAG: hypothetical protein UR63_C0013G0004 [Candidatus Roizmanbacteria bacterium GW2011_GWC2_35_12]KKP72969.1 MAG: hypothetical protein UR68_C0010G0004 [Candidatus Roizmanbacteria bacterium GW2011_GWA2_35_19]
MKRFLSSLILILLTCFFLAGYTVAQETPNDSPFNIIPPICGCPDEITKIYADTGGKEQCVSDIETFKSSPATSHLWIEDQEVTAQGKANDRARQFIFWVMTHNAIDNHPVLFNIWGTARNLAYFFTILSAALLGLGFIIGQRTNFETGVKVWPTIIKILLALLYISFSATVVITVVQLSEIFMKFFIENLGGKDLFNIYFSGISQERNYLDFVGCRDLNIRVQEAVKSEMMILKLTNISYYLMGGMLILRKIILWFLMFLSPFLAIVMFFSFIKNVGWIWIGVFFQWVFYGPLLALFLGSMATVWKSGIPFVFDFSRSGTTAGYIYPTAINILYGGPAQKLSAVNNGNYVDTFVEYIITLIMLWTVTIFPWFLLRIFRDYCCDGINAIKNMLLGAINQQRGPGPTPSPVAPTLNTPFSNALQMPRETTTNIRTKIETIEEIKKAKTEEIVKSLDIQASKITDVAHFETNKTTTETVTKNINFLKNPTQASTPTERLKYMNIRSELANRASKSDVVAQHVINSILFSKPQQFTQRQTIIKSLPKATTITNAISIKVNLPSDKVKLVSSSVIDYGTSDPKIATDIAATTNLSEEKVRAVMNQLHEKINEPAPQMLQKISDGTKVEKEKVAQVIAEFSKAISTNTKIAEEVALKQNINTADVKKVITAQAPILADSDKNIEQSVTVSPLVSLDEYEQVKKMWRETYEKGEIPLTENVRTREEWVDQDVVLITNTLNKLLSDEDALKNQALDEVGFILPIFLVNNLSGEQLVTYLKAKIEAAKQVSELQQKEKEITEKLKAKTEKVEVARPKKKEAEKTMKMQEEMKLT